VTAAPTLPQPFDSTYFQDPYAVYARLREESAAPQAALPHRSSTWLVTREADVRAGLTDSRLSVNKDHSGSGYKGFALPPALDANLLNIDPGDHVRLRRLVSKEFTPRRVEGLRGRVRAAAERLAHKLGDRLNTDGVAGLVDVFATPLPLTVIGDLLGIPAADRQPFALFMTGDVLLTSCGRPAWACGRRNQDRPTSTGGMRSAGCSSWSGVWGCQAVPEGVAGRRMRSDS